jgi:hypothetical protein
MTIKWHCAKEEDYEDLEDNDITSTYLRAISRDFLTESASRVVEFAHVSVKEYLQHRKDGNDLDYSSENCHEPVANICLRYLLRREQTSVNLEERGMYSTRMIAEQEDRNYEDDNDDVDFDAMPCFQLYTKYYWPAHVKFVDAYMSSKLMMKFSKFMSQDFGPSPAYERWASDIRSDNADNLKYWLSD